MATQLGSVQREQFNKIFLDFKWSDEYVIEKDENYKPTKKNGIFFSFAVEKLLKMKDFAKYSLDIQIRRILDIIQNNPSKISISNIKFGADSIIENLILNNNQIVQNISSIFQIFYRFSPENKKISTNLMIVLLICTQRRTFDCDELRYCCDKYNDSIRVLICRTMSIGFNFLSSLCFLNFTQTSFSNADIAEPGNLQAECLGGNYKNVKITMYGMKAKAFCLYI